jgi:uncharacterized protein YbaR (Trm112 family)/2-polyprenyl-3-methyl-5-hydroxy-6-metoxy-1,4-benzoquinol methylase
MTGALARALEETLCCPRCYGPLSSTDGEGISCSSCGATYPVHEGIPLLLLSGPGGQEPERRFRDEFAARCLDLDRDRLLEIVAQHHCVPVMLDRARAFRARVPAGAWILDLGVGWGWHWMGAVAGASVLGIDMSLGNLRVARRLLESDDVPVALVCADAAALPIRPGTVSGVWSVQTLQHLPDAAFSRAKQELDRVLSKEGLMEVHNLNAPWSHRLLYRVVGRRLHRSGPRGRMELRRSSVRETRAAWRDFRPGRVRISLGPSELFFHPELGLRPRPYPKALERLIATRLPRPAGWFARQVWVSVESH